MFENSFFLDSLDGHFHGITLVQSEDFEFLGHVKG